MSVLNFVLAAEVSEAVGEKLSIGEAAVTAIFGYCVVFFGLIILMCVLYGTGAYFKSKENKLKSEIAVNEKNVELVVPDESVKVNMAEKKIAPGSAGHVKLYNVPDKEAAMIMAIVADTMKKPVNELHFISIKEVK